ncbi:MAG: Cof-type HAD-IIB family hydrolase [Lachnospiraceae bacterium]
MNYKVLVLDLDGTLTNSEKKITEKTKQALFAAMDAGTTVVLASGRPTYGIVPLAEELELSKRGGYILSFNGARIMNCRTQEIIFQNTISENYLPVLVSLAEDYHVDYLTYENEDIITNNPDNQYALIESKINHMPLRYVEDMTQYVTFPINKMIMLGSGMYLHTIEPRLQREMAGALSVYRSEPFFLEVMPLGVDKAASLERLLAHMNLSREEMIAVGDGFNDLTMIEYAGLGVAMANAQEEVKEKADYITGSNDEDGVAQVVERFIL